MAFKENHVGVVSEVKFFINNLASKTPFVNNLKLQGSDDGTTFTDLYTVGPEIHEGWNMIDFEDGSLPSYHIYRFQGTSSGSCRVGEVAFTGIEAINDDNSSYSCTPKVMIDGVSTDLNAVTYDAAFTPVLTAMSKRFGSVLGGESVTFTGTGFSDSAATVVMIDNRECVVSA